MCVSQLEVTHAFLYLMKKRGLLLKERLCFPKSRCLPLKANPILEGHRPPGKQTGSHENYSSPLKGWDTSFMILFAGAAVDVVPSGIVVGTGGGGGGGGGGGAGLPNNLRGGGQHTLWPPP